MEKGHLRTPCFRNCLYSKIESQSTRLVLLLYVYLIFCRFNFCSIVANNKFEWNKRWIMIWNDVDGFNFITFWKRLILFSINEQNEIIHFVQCYFISGTLRFFSPFWRSSLLFRWKRGISNQVQPAGRLLRIYFVSYFALCIYFRRWGLSARLAP